MNWTRTPDTLVPQERALVGGKAFCLARLEARGFRTAPWLCITTHAYNAFVDGAGLRERIAMELHRKAFEGMRWEEIWDCATRIRHMFLTTPLPPRLQAALEQAVETRFGRRAVAVRSSATDEDTRRASFAGLHDSYINVRGTRAIIGHVHKVWASLWSDAALLYRQEIGLDVASSAMAVLVQALVPGRSSGVAFTVHPADPNQAVIEAVHGLNQGLVDGVIEPDRWVVGRDSRRIISHGEAERRFYMVPDRQDIEKAALPAGLAAKAPLSPDQVLDVFDHAMAVETAFSAPQDVEWTLAKDGLTLLQARPITTRPGQDDGDQRGWYLSLHKSFDQLVALRHKIEAEHIPAMVETARKLARIDPDALSDNALAEAIEQRAKTNQHWSTIYWSDFIPFAHGIRLFGQFYNDRMRPEDPYEFIDLLTRTSMESLERNRLLQELAGQVRDDPGLATDLSEALDQNGFERTLDDFLRRFGDLSAGVTGSRRADNDLAPLLGLIKEMARRPKPATGTAAAGPATGLKKAFLARFSGDKRAHAEAMLDLARSSYRLRDDDNIHLGRIEALFMAAVAAGRRRIRHAAPSTDQSRLEAALALAGPETETAPGAGPAPAEPGPFRFRQRQLVGQPAGPGLVRAPARVIKAPGQLMGFSSGEVLVCDAVDPNMTFVVPLAAGIVERRGGMLIHGAIIAREYGLPCVTGVPRATELIRTGDTVTVDGYLGIVTLG